MNKIQLFTYDISLFEGEQDMSFFSDALAEHISRFKLARDKLRSYCLYRLLRRALKADVLDVGFEPNGRPVLVGVEKQISLSHSGNMVAVAVSPQRHSIDVESVTDRILQLNPEKWLTKAEQRLSKILPPKKQIRYLTKIWTEKECYVKFAGKSLMSMFGQGAIDFAKIPIEFCFTAKFLRDVYGSKYCLTICSDGAARVIAKRVNELT